jgi:hypothetical protein
LRPTPSGDGTNGRCERSESHDGRGESREKHSEVAPAKQTSSWNWSVSEKTVARTEFYAIAIRRNVSKWRNDGAREIILDGVCIEVKTCAVKTPVRMQ